MLSPAMQTGRFLTHLCKTICPYCVNSLNLTLSEIKTLPKSVKWKNVKGRSKHYSLPDLSYSTVGVSETHVIRNLPRWDDINSKKNTVLFFQAPILAKVPIIPTFTGYAWSAYTRGNGTKSIGAWVQTREIPQGIELVTTVSLWFVLLSNS